MNTEGFPRTVAHVSLKAIQDNLSLLVGKLLRTYPRGAQVVPMVKCDAYGHGMVQVSQAIEKSKSVLAFGVATVQEGIELRKALIGKPIWVFSECTPWREEFAQACEKFDLVPILHTLSDVKKFILSKRQHPDLKFQLKFNTGLNRLGIEGSDASEVKQILLNENLKAQGLCTHFAESEKPRSQLSKTQAKNFKHLVQDFSSIVTSYIHCANTQAIVEESYLRVGEFCNVVRPGIGLYGYVKPNPDALPFTPALRWSARVLLHRQVKKGQRVGYGGTHRASKKENVVVLGLGYGDGFPRLLSNQHVLLPQKTKAKVLGRVSMDLTALEANAQPGDWICFLGQHPEQGFTIAEKSKTIVYEILTSISPRVPRIYELG